MEKMRFWNGNLNIAKLPRACARHCPKRAHTAKMRAHGLKFDPGQQIPANFCFLKEFFEKLTKKISKSKK